MEGKVSEKIVLKEGLTLMRSFTWKHGRKAFWENSLKRRVVLDEIIYMEEKYERLGFWESSLKRRVVLDEIIYMEEKYERLGFREGDIKRKGWSFLRGSTVVRKHFTIFCSWLLSTDILVNTLLGRSEIYAWKECMCLLVKTALCACWVFLFLVTCEI